MLDWLFRDRTTGRITVAQTPNVPLAVFAVAWLLRALLHPPGAAGTVLRVVEIGALAFWAGDEVLRGVNPWRRMLGGAVLAALVVSLLV